MAETMTPADGDEISSLKTYFAELGRIPLLTRDEEKALARRARAGERDAIRRLAESNLRFVVSVAKNYRGRGMPLPDLIAEGNVGLLKAIDHYDPERGVRFISYAVWWIRQTITESLQEFRNIVHIPANRVENLAKYLRAEQSETQRLGHSASLDDMARRLKLARTEVDRIQGDSPMFSSTDQPLGDSDSDRTFGDLLEDGSAPPVDSLVNLASLRSDLSEVLSEIPPRERRILEMRYGLSGKPAMTLQQAGRRLGLSRERVRQLEHRALSRLRKPGQVDWLREHLN